MRDLLSLIVAWARSYSHGWNAPDYILATRKSYRRPSKEEKELHPGHRVALLYGRWYVFEKEFFTYEGRASQSYLFFLLREMRTLDRLIEKYRKKAQRLAA